MSVTKAWAFFDDGVVGSIQGPLAVRVAAPAQHPTDCTTFVRRSDCARTNFEEEELIENGGRFAYKLLLLQIFKRLV